MGKHIRAKEGGGGMSVYIDRDQLENFAMNCVGGEVSLRQIHDFPAADVVEQPRWIPVTERLPEPNAVDEYGFAKGYLVKTDRHVMIHTARYTGEWWILWGKAEVITDTVTHWMPLPEPPKGDE